MNITDFRVWNKEVKLFFSFDFFIGFNGKSKDWGKPELFIGTRDNEGEKIYLGDKLRVDFYRNGIDHLDTEDESGYYIGTVTFYPSCGYVLTGIKEYNDEDTTGSFLKIKHHRSITASRSKIIGHIHEDES